MRLAIIFKIPARVVAFLFSIFSVLFVVAESASDPLWINDIVHDVIAEIGEQDPVLVTIVVGERLEALANSTRDDEKREYLKPLLSSGNSVERWAAFRTRLSDSGYVMMPVVYQGNLVLPHSGRRYAFDMAGQQALTAFEQLFDQSVPVNTTPWVVDSAATGSGGRSGWAWYSDAAINLNGRIALALEEYCPIDVSEKIAMVAINETTHTMLYRLFRIRSDSEFDWASLTNAVDGVPVSRAGEISEFVSDVASINASRCAYILAFDHILDRYLRGTEDDHHLSGRFFRDRVGRWEQHTGSPSVGRFSELLGQIITFNTASGRGQAVKRVIRYFTSDVMSDEFVTFIKAEYMSAGRRVLKHLNDNDRAQ